MNYELSNYKLVAKRIVNSQNIMIKLMDIFKVVSGCLFVCLLLIGSACQSETPQKKTPTPQKKTVKKQKPRKAPSPYWTAARKEIPLNKEQESKVKAIQTEYKTKTETLKKQNKWDDKQRGQLEKQKGKDIEAALGADLYKKYDNFNENWNKKKKTPAPSAYWTAARKEIPLSEKEVDKIQAINQKYKTRTSNLVKQKKWNAKEKSKSENLKNKDIKAALGKKYDKYSKFNENWQKRKK